MSTATATKAGAETAPAIPTYYNPVNTFERVRVWHPDHADPDAPGFVRPYTIQFAFGAIRPKNELEEESVRRALRVYGPQRPDEWRGGDLREAWSCPKCRQFVTENYHAREHHLGVRHG